MLQIERSTLAEVSMSLVVKVDNLGGGSEGLSLSTLEHFSNHGRVKTFYMV